MTPHNIVRWIGDCSSGVIAISPPSYFALPGAKLKNLEEIELKEIEEIAWMKNLAFVTIEILTTDLKGPLKFQ